MTFGELVPFPQEIKVSRRRINTLARQVLVGNNALHSYANGSEYSMDVLNSLAFSFQAVQLGEGFGKTPEEAIVRALYTAHRATNEHIHPSGLIESRIGRISEDVSMESRLGHIAAKADMVISRAGIRKIEVHADIGSGDGGESPLAVSGPGIITALQELADVFDFNSEHFEDEDMTDIETLPLTAFDELR